MQQFLACDLSNNTSEVTIECLSNNSPIGSMSILANKTHAEISFRTKTVTVPLCLLRVTIVEEIIFMLTKNA
jgi:hypothetical protein